MNPNWHLYSTKLSLFISKRIPVNILTKYNAIVITQSSNLARIIYNIVVHNATTCKRPTTSLFEHTNIVFKYLHESYMECKTTIYRVCASIDRYLSYQWLYTWRRDFMNSHKMFSYEIDVCVIFLNNFFFLIIRICEMKWNEQNLEKIWVNVRFWSI